MYLVAGQNVYGQYVNTKDLQLPKKFSLKRECIYLIKMVQLWIQLNWLLILFLNSIKAYKEITSLHAVTVQSSGVGNEAVGDKWFLKEGSWQTCKILTTQFPPAVVGLDSTLYFLHYWKIYTHAHNNSSYFYNHCLFETLYYELRLSDTYVFFRAYVLTFRL